MQQMNRRDLFRGGLATALSTAPAAAIDYTKPVPEAEGLTAYQNGDEIILRWNNHVLTTYRAHESMKYPYFYPIAGPVTGASLTTESALPYPHHRGLWLGCEPLNGGNYWADNALSTGHIRSVGISLGETTKTSAVIQDRCDWVREGAPSPWRDEREFTVKVLNDKCWVIDADLRITALEDVSIKKAKHSLYAIRTASDICPPYGGTLMNSEGGITAKGTYGKTAKWCSFFGKRRGTGPVEGIAVMDHPENPWSPCPWFTRDYGHLSPSPLNFIEKPWTMVKGESIRLRYRVAAHAGDPAAANLDEVYNQWIRG